MSGTALNEILRWDRPPATHPALRAIQPVFLLDWQIYGHNKRGIESLYGEQLASLIPSCSEEDFERLIDSLRHVLGTIDSYLKVRGTEGPILRRIRQQRCVIVDAVEAIKRGYAPGQVPKESERLATASTHLQAHQA
jgi:hypothetical protein